MPPTHTARTILGAAAVLGLLGDQLFRVPVWGLNLALWASAIAGGGLVLVLVGKPAPDRARSGTVWPWLGVTFFAAMWAVRDAPLLLAFDLLAILGLLSIGLIQVQGVVLRAAGVVPPLVGPVRAAWEAATGAVRLMRDLPPLAAAGGGAAQRARAVGLGLALAIPPLVVFGSLFASADPIFRATVSSLFGFDLARFVSHVTISGALAWAAVGFWWAVARPAGASELPVPLIRLGAVPVLTAVGATALVFILFVATQARSLFGGEAYVLAATGLTYAEYARDGFFQMLFASALALPLVYAVPFIAGGTDERDARSLRALLAVQLALTALVLGSALWRMGLYVKAYGLTEDRLYGTAVMVWIAATIAVFARTVLRGQPQSAAFGSLVAAAVTLGVLNLGNPTALIARYNLAHQDRREADVAHLVRLRGDAVPVLVSHFESIPAAKQCPLAKELISRHAAGTGDWRGWNLARARAQASVRTLEVVAQSCIAPAPLSG